ncbi:hypothetical protein QTP88_008856 [Uroleucon formosanum]
MAEEFEDNNKSGRGNLRRIRTLPPPPPLPRVSPLHLTSLLPSTDPCVRPFPQLRSLNPRN